MPGQNGVTRHLGSGILGVQMYLIYYLDGPGRVPQRAGASFLPPLPTTRFTRCWFVSDLFANVLAHTGNSIALILRNIWWITQKPAFPPSHDLSAIGHVVRAGCTMCAAVGRPVQGPMHRSRGNGLCEGHVPLTLLHPSPTARLLRHGNRTRPGKP